MAIKFDSKKLKNERERLGYSFEELARALRVIEPKATKAVVWNWENQDAQPAARYMHAIAQVFGREESYFQKKVNK